MDISKFKIPTLNGLNWGLWFIHLQSSSRILDIWDVMQREVLNTTPPTRDLLAKPTPVAANATATEVAAYNTAKAIWSKKNAQGLGLIQATVSPVIWQNYQTLGTAKEVLDTLEAEFGAVGGGHQPTSNWSTWWKFNSPIWQICCHKFKLFRTTTIESRQMATADSPKTLPPSCFARVFQTHMNQLPSNIWITSQLLPIINYWISLHKFSKKRPEEGLKLLDKARPSTSSQVWRTSGKSVLSVANRTTQCKITGPGGRIWIKRARDNKSPKNCWICLEKRRQTKRGRAKKTKRHKQVPMYYLYWNWLICLYKQHNQLIFPATKREWESRMVLG